MSKKSKSKIDYLSFGIAIASGIGGAVATNVAKNELKKVIENDTARNIGVPLVIFGGSVATGLMFPSLALPASAVAIGSGYHLLDGLVGASPWKDKKKEITGLAGDEDDGAVVVNGEAELLAYAKALNPGIPDDEIKKQIESNYQQPPIKDAVVVGGEEDELNGNHEDLM